MVGNEVADFFCGHRFAQIRHDLRFCIQVAYECHVDVRELGLISRQLVCIDMAKGSFAVLEFGIIFIFSTYLIVVGILPIQIRCSGIAIDV